MLYRKELPREKVLMLINFHYKDIYAISREMVFMAKLEGKPTPTVTASLLPEDWEALAEMYDVFLEGPYGDVNGMYEKKDVIWLTQGTEPTEDFPANRLNLFIYRDQYKEIK